MMCKTRFSMLGNSLLEDFWLLFNEKHYQEAPVLTQQCLFLWQGYVCRGTVPYMPLTSSKGTLCLWSLRWLRSPLEAASGTVVVTQRAMCHPLLPLQFPSPLPSQSILFLLLSVLLILQNSWIKILIIKENCICNLCWLLGSQKNVLPQKFSEIPQAFSAVWRWMCKHTVSWALTYTFLKILRSMVSFPFINVKITSRYNTMYNFSSLDFVFLLALQSLLHCLTIPYGMPLASSRKCHSFTLH